MSVDFAFIDSVEETVAEKVKSIHKGISGILTVQGEDLNILRQTNGAILMIPWGRKNGNVIEGVDDTLTAEALKIVINAIYGKLGFDMFWLYDRQRH